MDRDPRNRLNNLTNSEWLHLTNSVWWNSDDPKSSSIFRVRDSNSALTLEAATAGEIPTIINSHPPPPDKLKRQHPATFAECDIRKLILFFSKRGDTILDPFLGAGSTMLACFETKRNCIGIELFWRWVSLSKKRLVTGCADSLKKCKVAKPNEVLVDLKDGLRYRILCGDSRMKMKILEKDSVDLVITSPPYWNILEKTGDYKVLHTRKNNGLPTNYGTSTRNLANISQYGEFLHQLQKIFLQCARVLRVGKYLCVVAADFRHGDKFYPYHAHLINTLERCGLALEGITIIVNNRKHLYPYGLPYAYVPNIHHSYVLIFKNKASLK